MTDFTIRKALPEDAALLTEMRLEMRRERETVRLTIPETEFEKITFDYFSKALAADDFSSFLAFDGEQCAACSAMTIHQHAPSYGNLSGKTGYIFNIYTRPVFRRRGLAVRLLDALIAEASEQGCCKVGLNASPAGRGVYLKYGFHEIDGEMELTLPRS